MTRDELLRLIGQKLGDWGPLPNLPSGILVDELVAARTLRVLDAWTVSLDEVLVSVVETAITEAIRAQEDASLSTTFREARGPAVGEDRPRLAGPGAVQRAVELGLSTVRYCPRCGAGVCLVRASNLELWVVIEGRPAVTGSVWEVRPAPKRETARRKALRTSPHADRDVETALRPPIVIRCHGDSRTLPRSRRGAERCGALLRIDDTGMPKELDEPAADG